MRVGSLASGNARLPVGISLTQQSRKDVRTQRQAAWDTRPRCAAGRQPLALSVSGALWAGSSVTPAILRGLEAHELRHELRSSNVALALVHADTLP